MSTIANPEPLFVTGTGCCGSTLISNFLREHPKILSLSEFFNHLTDMYRLTTFVFPEGILSAEDFWEILSVRGGANGLLARNGVLPKEVLYQMTSNSPRLPVGDVPALLLTTLPHLSANPDDLYDDIAEAVASFAEATIGIHYSRLFSWLCERFGKQVWAERSGGSLILMPQYLEHFPDAKFLHVARDGRDCAVSMSRHRGFKMAAIMMATIMSLGYDPYFRDDLGSAELAAVPDEIRSFLPDRFDPQRFLAYQLPPYLFGEYWSDEMERGLQALSSLPRDRVLHLYYEDVLEFPEESMGRIIEFIGQRYADDQWIRRCVAQISAPTASWTQLPENERLQLHEACQRGFRALEKHGVVRLTGQPVHGIQSQS